MCDLLNILKKLARKDGVNGIFNEVSPQPSASATYLIDVAFVTS